MARRADETAAALAGSQRQVQYYVNGRPEWLKAAVRAAFIELSQARLRWRNPSADAGYVE